MRSVEAHLANCPTCQQHVADASADSFVASLRRARSVRRRICSARNRQAAGHARRPIVRDSRPSRPRTCPADDGKQPVSVPRVWWSTPLPDRPPVGHGGMGSVYEAEHRVMQRRVALKVINDRYLATPDVAARFRREVRAAARLSHRNIVTAYDAERAGSNHFLVMEFVEGVTIGRLVKEHGPLPVAEACDYAGQAALGLQHAHEQGLVHRDIKPDNLVRDPGGVVKVLDFGLAALTTECRDALRDTSPVMDTTASQLDGNDQHLTCINEVMGTLDFMAPEQAANAHAVDIRADVYSLGCTLYYMLTGRVLYPEPSRLQKTLAHREQPVPSVRQMRSEVPRRPGRRRRADAGQAPGRPLSDTG